MSKIMAIRITLLFSIPIIINGFKRRDFEQQVSFILFGMPAENYYFFII
jgi:hypothetical protein